MPIHEPIIGKGREKSLKPTSHIPEPQKRFSLKEEGSKHETGNRSYPLRRSRRTRTGLAHANAQALSCLPHYFLSEETFELTSQVKENMVSHIVNFFLTQV